MLLALVGKMHPCMHACKARVNTFPQGRQICTIVIDRLRSGPPFFFECPVVVHPLEAEIKMKWNFLQILLKGSVIALLCLYACLSPTLHAQIDTGGITGTAQDPSGAVIANANVTLTNEATAVRTATRSTATGTYFFGGVLPGTYTITGQMNGFENYVVHGIQVHVQQVLTVDLRFATGNVQQQVTVTAAAPLLEAENA